MQRAVKRKNFIYALLIALFCFIAGIFFIEKKELAVSANAETVTASEDFYMQEGMALSLDSMQCRFTVNITPEMYTLLNKPTESKVVLISPSYKPTPYYLRVTQFFNETEVYSVLYHTDPVHSRFLSEPLELDYGLTVYLPFPINMSDFEQEYLYVCEFIQTEEVYVNTVGEALTPRATFPTLLVTDVKERDKTS